MSKHADFVRSLIDLAIDSDEELILGVFVRISGPASLGLHGRAERVAYLGLTNYRVYVVTKNLKKMDTLPLRSGMLGHSVRLGRDFLSRPVLTVRHRNGETRYRFKRGDASLAEQIANALSELANMPETLRRDLLRYLGATSEERARLIGELTARYPAMTDLLADLEFDDDDRARVEIELMRSLQRPR